MIKVIKRYEVTFADTATSFSYSFLTDNACVTVPSPGTIQGNSGTITAEFFFQNEACFDNAQITLVCQSNENCSLQSTFTISNPCAVTVNIGVSELDGVPYGFTAVVNGGIPNFEFTWDFDQSIFTLQRRAGQQLSVNVIPGVTLPETTPIRVYVTDSRGCSAEASVTYNFCIPSVDDVAEVLQCVTPVSQRGCLGTMDAQAINVPFTATTCDGSEIDWSTAVFNMPTGVCVEPILRAAGQYSNRFNFYVRDNVTPGLLTGTWSVANDRGVRSFTANVSLLLGDCEETNPVVIADELHELTAADISLGNTISTDLEDGYIVSEEEIDWSSFTFIAATGQTLVDQYELTATNGTATLDIDRNINYEVDTQNENVDLVQFQVATTSGAVSNTGRFYYNYEPLPAPVTVADTDTIACGEPVTIDLIGNDTGDFNLNSLTITQEPSQGTYTLNPDGSINYLSYGEGADQLKYVISSPDGIVSNESEINITIQCAGNSVTHTICPETIVDLEALLGTFTAGGVWAQDAGNPDTVVLTSPDAVDFDTIAFGTFVFTYTIGSSVATITIIHPEYGVNILSVSGPYTNASSNLVVNVRFETAGVIDFNTISILVSHGVGPTNTFYIPDAWNGTIGEVEVLVVDGDGVHTIAVSVDDFCGNKVADSNTDTDLP
jgi:hypothetical protein